MGDKADDILSGLNLTEVQQHTYQEVRRGLQNFFLVKKKRHLRAYYIQYASVGREECGLVHHCTVCAGRALSLWGKTQ